MKRFTIFALICLFTTLAISYVYSYGRSSNYDLKCYACKEKAYNRRGKTDYGCSGCHAWRMFELEKLEKYQGYFIYNCPHGHTLLVSKSNPNEIKYWDINAKEYHYIDISKF